MITTQMKAMLVALTVVLLVAAVWVGVASGQACCSTKTASKMMSNKSLGNAMAAMTPQEQAAAKKVEAAGVGYLTASALTAKIQSGQPPIIVDVLSAEDYLDAHLKGAINIPYKQVKSLAPQVLPDKTAEIVVYCGSYQCGASLAAAKSFKELGYTNIYDYKGGIMEWQEKRLPIGGSATTK